MHKKECNGLQKFPTLSKETKNQSGSWNQKEKTEGTQNQKCGKVSHLREGSYFPSNGEKKDKSSLKDLATTLWR